MELRHLRYFVAVAEELHFGRAAERLRIAKSALSTRIQALKRHLGVRLLQRSKRSSVALADAGTLVLEEARRTFQQAERTELVGRRAGRGELGRVEIGYVVSAALAGEEFVVPHFGVEESGFQEQITEIGRHGPFAPRVVHRVRGFISAASPVAAGIGVAVVPASLRCLQLPGVVYLPLAEAAVSADPAAAFRRDERAKAARAFIEQFRKSAPPAASWTTT